MATIKTQRNANSVRDFLNSVEPESKRKDSFELLSLFEELSGHKAEMWGENIIGFGNCKLVYASGREVDWMLTGFSPRKQKISLYIMDGFSAYTELLTQLGKHKTSKACLYINKLSDINMDVLKDLLTQSVATMKERDNG